MLVMSAMGIKGKLQMSFQALQGMSQIFSGAALARVSEDSLNPLKGMPLMSHSGSSDQDPSQSEPQREEPEREEPEREEPEWEEPEWDNVTIAKVVWAGYEGWDRAVYDLSNGKSVFASTGLDVGDSPFDYDEIRTSGGGYYDAPDGVVGHAGTRRGGALIIQEGERFKQQQYVWGRQGPVMAPSTQDVTKQIHQIEEREDQDMDGDLVIGAPVDELEENEIKKVIFDGETDFDRSIYEMTDGTVILAEQGLEVGSLPIEDAELKNKDGSPLETSGIVAITGMRDGFGVIYNNDGVVKQLPFKWGQRGVQVSGKLRKITSQVSLIEEREGIDIDGDGRIGTQIDDDAEVESVVYRAGRDGFDRSLYKMTNNQFVLGEPGLEKGDIPFDSEALTRADGSSFDADGAVGLLGLRRGFGVVFESGGKFSMQQFSWARGVAKAKGKLADVTKRIFYLEEDEGVDFTGDGIIGEQYSGDDPEISKVIFPGNDEYEDGLYVLNNGNLVFAESDLDPGDTPFEDEVIMNKSGKPYNASNVVGIYEIRSGFALIEDSDGVYTEQGFRFKGNSGPKQYGKKRKVKNIDKVERKASFDINGDGLIGGEAIESIVHPQFGGGGKGEKSIVHPQYRLVDSLGMSQLVDPLA